MADVVYVIGPEDSQTVKIGFSNKSRRRLREIQMMSPLPLDILWSCPGGKDLEDALHGRFRKYRTHGEWFAFPAYMEPVRVIRNAADVFQYAANSFGTFQSWADAPICEAENRRHWLNTKVRNQVGNGPFTLAQVAAALGAPLAFVEKYAAELVEAGSLVPQAGNDPMTYVPGWLEIDRWDLLGPRPERTSAME